MGRSRMTPAFEPELIPVADFSRCHCEGWRMLSGYDLKAGDYAVLMVPPRGKTWSNKEAGNTYRISEHLRQLMETTSQEGA